MKLVEIKDVLAPCDYEELQRLKKENDNLSALITGGELEIGHLRALLKDCKETIEAQKKFFAPAFECCKDDYNRILTRINAALGENVTKPN